jgi:alcohol dehydrogenase class IV
MTGFAFTARSFSWRLHCSEGAIESQLRPEVARLGASRAFIVSSPSIAARTSTVARAERALGEMHAGTFSGIENDSTYSSVAAATEAARSVGADLIVAVGGGSVIVAARAVDIFLCESGDPLELMTQYPPGERAHSPRLNSPKLPIINVVTTPTSAMNRAGTGLKNPDLTQRMEYFDPKTRPASIIWDWAALAATPFAILRSTAITTFLGAWAAILREEPNLLVNADRQQAYASARGALHQLVADPDSVAARLALCTAAFLANRAEDDHAGPMIRTDLGDGFATGDYAIATALHVRYPDVGQGEAGSVLAATAIRRSPTAPIEFVRRAAVALGCWGESMSAAQGQDAVATALEDLLHDIGMPTRVSQLGFAREDIPSIAEQTVRNCNADPAAGSVDARIAASVELLQAAW